MKKMILLLFFTILGSYPLTQAKALYKGKLTCGNIDSFLTEYNLPDGRVRGLCQGAVSACIAHETLEKISPEDPLRVELEEELEAHLNFQLGLCELGFIHFAPNFYKDKLAN
jgi:hypothetical protein